MPQAAPEVEHYLASCTRKLLSGKTIPFQQFRSSHATLQQSLTCDKCDFTDDPGAICDFALEQDTAISDKQSLPDPQAVKPEEEEPGTKKRKCAVKVNADTRMKQ